MSLQRVRRNVVFLGLAVLLSVGCHSEYTPKITILITDNGRLAIGGLVGKDPSTVVGRTFRFSKGMVATATGSQQTTGHDLTVSMDIETEMEVDIEFTGFTEVRVTLNGSEVSSTMGLKPGKYHAELQGTIP